MSMHVPFQTATPRLHPSQLSFRLGLARSRTGLYPLHSLDFILMDLERPDACTRHAHWCTGDLTGRLLEFLSCAEGLDGKHDERLPELFARILRTQRPSGLFGRFAASARTASPPEDELVAGGSRLFSGLVRYYEASGDWRALEGAVGMAEVMLRRRDAWVEHLLKPHAIRIEWWVTEGLAQVYRLTGDGRYLDFCGQIGEAIDRYEYLHSHGLMSTLRGLQLAALYSGDAGLARKPEEMRRLARENAWPMPDGCVTESFPHSFRNEGCSIADWLMLNLNAGLLTGDGRAYEAAQNTLWNALFFNQFISGSFGHRDLTPSGYEMGPISEAWWCCLHHCGMAMTEYARHAVTLRGATVHVNLLVPGEFTLRPPEGGKITVTVATGFPASATTYVTVSGLPAGYEVDLRVPDCVHEACVEHTRYDAAMRVKLTGRLGHHLEQAPGGVVLRYGPLVLAPMFYYWNTASRPASDAAGVPQGYIPATLPPGIPRLLVGEGDEHRLLDLPTEPLPEWSYCEEGPGLELSMPGAAVNVPAAFDNGETVDLRFNALCQLTSNMTLNETPILFQA
jgi:hypothetical protein